MRCAKRSLLSLGLVLAGGCVLSAPPTTKFDLAGIKHDLSSMEGNVDFAGLDLTGVDLAGLDFAQIGRFDLAGSDGAMPIHNNVVPIIVDGGPANNTYNRPFISIKLCAPGSTTNCQTISHIAIDTASVGLRVVASAIPNLSAMPNVTQSSKNLTECYAFSDGFSYGSMRKADLYIAGESALSLPFVALADPAYAVPADCSQGGTEEDNPTTLGANGILGAGLFSPDCGTDCTVPSNPATPTNPSYFSCTGATCTEVGVPVATQVPNPVKQFSSDNNGLIIELPSVPDNGAINPTGSLVFGIGTQSNNAITGLKVYPATVSGGLTTISVTIGGTTYGSTYFDAGATDIGFTGSSLPECTDPSLANYLCPTVLTSFTATLGAGTGSLIFKVVDPSTLLAAGSAFNDTATTGFANAQYFAFGLPVFFGHHVAFAFSGASTPAGTGPFFGL